MKMGQGMSRKGNCWDNAPTERFFRSLKHERPNYEKFRTKAPAKLSVIGYLAFYNGKRSHSKLGYQSPLQYERDSYRKAAWQSVRFYFTITAPLGTIEGFSTNGSGINRSNLWSPLTSFDSFRQDVGIANISPRA
jgi:Integrase core domain